DRALAQRESEGRPIKVAMIGAGFMARGIANQIVNSVPGMRLVAIANRNLENAQRCYKEAGVPFKPVRTVGALADSIKSDQYAITEDANLLCDVPEIDCLFEVTGAIEF